MLSLSTVRQSRLDRVVRWFLTIRTANGISWGGLAPEMFGIHGVYHMVPICLAIGVFLPLPFIAAVSAALRSVCGVLSAHGAFHLVVHLAERWLRELQHSDHHAVFGVHVSRHQHLDQPVDGHWSLLPVVGTYALPAVVYEVQVRLQVLCHDLTRRMHTEPV